MGLQLKLPAVLNDLNLYNNKKFKKDNKIIKFKKKVQKSRGKKKKKKRV